MSVPEILFVCGHNAGRSQMAAALVEERAAGRSREEVRSIRDEIERRVGGLLEEMISEPV